MGRGKCFEIRRLIVCASLILKKYEKEPRRVLDTRRGASYNVGRKVEYLLADCSASNFIQKSPKQGPSLWAVFCYLSFFSNNTTRDKNMRKIESISKSLMRSPRFRTTSRGGFRLQAPSCLRYYHIMLPLHLQGRFCFMYAPKQHFPWRVEPLGYGRARPTCTLKLYLMNCIDIALLDAFLLVFLMESAFCSAS